MDIRNLKNFSYNENIFNGLLTKMIKVKLSK